MKFSKILFIICIIALVSVFTMNVGFAASNEKITKYKEYQWDKHDTKIVNINCYTINVKDSKSYYIKSKSSYKINIKKPYKNNYKINSINVKYAVYGKNTYDFKKYIYKNITLKNKNSVTIKDKNADTRIEKITINYNTKSKIKKESPNLWEPKGNWKRVVYFYGNKSKAILKENGYMKRGQYGCDGSYSYAYSPTNQKLKVSTTNNKYKIDKVKLIFYGHVDNIEGTTTHKAYGKNSLLIKSYGKHNGKYLGDFRIYYR